MSRKDDISEELSAGEATGRRWVKLRVLGSGQDREMMGRLEKFADSLDHDYGPWARHMDDTDPFGASGRLYFIMSDPDDHRDRGAAHVFWESAVFPLYRHDTHTQQCPPAAFVEGFIAGALKAWEEAKQAA